MRSAAIIESEQKILMDIVALVRDFLNPRRIIIFGSRISGRGREYSDFDIAVEGAEMNIRNERLLKDALDDKLGIITVDLINLDKVDSKFKQLVLQTGRVIYEQ
jgi:predicted nucleotidyltransferase